MNEFSQLSKEEIISQRKNRFLLIGRKKGFKTDINSFKKLSFYENLFIKIKAKINIKILIPSIIVFLFIFLLIFLIS